MQDDSPNSSCEAHGSQTQPPEGMTQHFAGSGLPLGLITPPSIPGYEILGELGRGGMGVVYKARQIRLNRLVALKMVLTGTHASASELVRFLSEAEAAAQLRHPNIVQIHEFGQHERLPFFTMEYIEGGSLTAHAQAPLPPLDAARLVKLLADGVGYAHGHGIVHRDLKPDNILLQPEKDNTQTLCPKVTDFGLAKRITAGSGLTATGMILGTPSYMAPEQASGTQSIGASADVWALGAILYRLLTGRPPFLAANPIDTIRQVVEAEPPLPSHLVPGIPRDLETICLKCLQKDPAKRYPTGTELADDLSRFLSGQPITARPIGAMERMWKWGKRNKALAGALAGLILALAAGIGVSLAFAVQARRDADRADQEAIRATESETEARKQAFAATQARYQASRLLYVSNLRLADQMWHEVHGSPRAMADLLAEHVPVHPDDPDFREFSWRFQWTRLNQSAQVFTLPAPAMHLAVTAAGSLVTLAADGHLRVLDSRSGKVVRNTPPSGRSSGLALSADGRIAGVGAVGAIRFVDTTTGKVLATVASKKMLRRLALSANGRFAASVWEDRRVLFHEVATGVEIASVQVPNLLFRCLAISSDGQTVVLGNHPSLGQVTAYDRTTGKPTTISKHASTVTAVGFSPDGRWIASGDFNGWVTNYDVAQGRITDTKQVIPWRVSQLAFALDGRKLVCGGRDGSLVQWDLTRSPPLLKPLKGHAARVTGVAYLPGGKHLVSSDRSGILRVWNLDYTSGVRPLAEMQSSAAQMALDQDGNWLAVVALDGNVQLWDRNTKTRIQTMGVPKAFLLEQGNPYPSIALAANRSLLAAGWHSSRVTVWNPATGKEIWTTPEIPLKRYGPPHPFMPMDAPRYKRVVSALAFSPDARFLAAGFGIRNGKINNYDQIVKVWNVRDRAEIATLRVKNTVVALRFSADGQELLAGSHDGWIRSWQVGTWNLVKEWKFPSDVTAFDFSRDGQVLAIGLANGTLVIRDLTTGKETHRTTAHTGPVVAVSFSCDGRTIATGGRVDRSVKLWEATSLRETVNLRFGETVNGITFSPDGNQLLAAFSSGVWVIPAAPLREIDRVGGPGRLIAPAVP